MNGRKEGGREDGREESERKRILGWRERWECEERGEGGRLINKPQ